MESRRLYRKPVGEKPMRAMVLLLGHLLKNNMVRGVSAVEIWFKEALLMEASIAGKYQWNDDGDIKSEGIYAERMSGMLVLFVVIVQMPDIGGQPNPFPVHHGWTWLVRIINMPPWAISPLLVQTFLSVAGPAMLGVYGRQMDKLISVLATTWIVSVVNLSPLTVAGKSNLTMFFDENRSLGNIHKCKGHVIKTF
ncbi:Nuclear pore complex nucleoporin component [Coemansia sp. RSA 451]|nr:Nuclear pore complex nucleoporin component [Coemansia sp. RSA 451]